MAGALQAWAEKNKVNTKEKRPLNSQNLCKKEGG
jgi:hypothetical protein